MMPRMRVGAGAVIAGIVAQLVSLGSARAVTDEDSPTTPAPPNPVRRERPVRFTIGQLAGTGYGWSNGSGDVNADVPFSGGSWARLGHLVVEGGLLLPRARLFFLTGPRYQFVTGTTDIYDVSGNIYRPRSRALAWFTKAGWLPRSPEARLQPYVLVSAGVGRIIHLAPLTSFSDNCGMGRNEPCVDTISSGPFFIGAGTGLRLRLNHYLDAIVAVDAQLGAPDRTYNLDVNLGLAVVI
jgi:hypothetical protein